MKYKAAIFDLDGTLIDSTWVWYSMIEEFCKIYNLDREINYMAQTVHMPPTEFIEFLKKTHSLKEDVGEIKEKLLEIATRFYANEVPLKKGAKRLLTLMKKNNIKMSIATSCFVELTEIVLKKWNVYDMFSHFLYSEELKTNKKSAFIYVVACEKMNVNFSESAVFEDICMPLEEVKSYGMGYFAVEDENRTQEVKDILKRNANYYIKDYDEFIDSGSFEKFFDVETLD